MLQSLGAYSPWGGGSSSHAAGGGDKRKRRTRRQKAKQFGLSGTTSAPSSPTPTGGALAAGSNERLTYEIEYGGQEEQQQHPLDDDDSASGSGSDVEDPLYPSRPVPSHLRPSSAVANQPLYGNIWCTATESQFGPEAAPSSVLESAGFAVASWSLNILLLIFLLWTSGAPRCGEAWFASQPVAGENGLSATILPSVGGASSTPTLTPSELPPDVRMPYLMPLFSVPPNPERPVAPAAVAAAPAHRAHEIPAQKRPADDEEETPPTAKQHEQEPHSERAHDSVREQKHEEAAAEPPAASTPKPIESSKGQPDAGSPSSVVVLDALQTQVAASSSPEDVDAFQRGFDVSSSHRLVWEACREALVPPPGTAQAKDSLVGAPPQQFCAETAVTEQIYQLSWFGKHVAAGFVGERRFVPEFQSCVQMQPEGYRWPDKTPELPYAGGAEGSGAVHWPNLRVASVGELVQFNPGTPKNLFHFKAHQYDQDGLEEMALAAKYIPLKEKVRLMLDIGAGGGSLGVLMKRAYDVTTVASAFADWPYCEYMTERGELCLLVDVMEAMPWAQRSFDLIHVSWVYHGQAPNELWDFVHEIDRVLRPGGYLYLRGGWSNSQIIAQRSMLSNLGYTVLYEKVSQKPVEVSAKVSFGADLPYNADWVAILLKPIRASPAAEAVCDKRRQKEEQGKVKLPLKARNAPTQEGNVYEE